MDLKSKKSLNLLVHLGCLLFNFFPFNQYIYQINEELFCIFNAFYLYSEFNVWDSYIKPTSNKKKDCIIPNTIIKFLFKTSSLERNFTNFSYIFKLSVNIENLTVRLHVFIISFMFVKFQENKKSKNISSTNKC